MEGIDSKSVSNSAYLKRNSRDIGVNVDPLTLVKENKQEDFQEMFVGAWPVEMGGPMPSFGLFIKKAEI